MPHNNEDKYIIQLISDRSTDAFGCDRRRAKGTPSLKKFDLNGAEICHRCHNVIFTPMMKVSTAVATFSLLVINPWSLDARTVAPPTYLVQQKLMEKSHPDTGESWMTLSNGIEYQPAANLSPLAQRHLRQMTSNYPTGNFEKMFVDGAETYYDEYAQAWRALGFYIDCGYRADARRALQEGEGGCTRYMLWAAVSEASKRKLCIVACEVFLSFFVE